MVDLILIIIGILIGCLAVFMYKMYQSTQNDIRKLSHIDSKIANDLVGEIARCPDCKSYNIRLVDPNSNLVWLNGLIPEIDYYECLKCGRCFSDEEWMDAKSYD
jgi:uncharacterized protein with PIN domain